MVIEMLCMVEHVNMIDKNGGEIKGGGKEETVNNYGWMDEWVDGWIYR